MEVIGSEVLRSYSSTRRISNRTCGSIRRGESLEVKDFLDLAKKIARLQFENPNYVMLFRGQQEDYQRENTGGTSFTSLAPSLFRQRNGQNLTRNQILEKFEKLKVAEDVY